MTEWRLPVDSGFALELHHLWVGCRVVQRDAGELSLSAATD